MAKEEFFQNLQAAASFLAPQVEADSPYVNSAQVERTLLSTDIWLTQTSVEGFDVHDFDDLPAPVREALASHVARFREIARDVPPTKPASRRQVQDAWPQFKEILLLVKQIRREEWIPVANALVEEAERWIGRQGWPVKRYPKRISEEGILGTYELTKLVFAAEGSQLVLTPVARFVPFTDGLFELAALPDYETVLIAREGSRWYLRESVEDRRRREWSESTFVEMALDLARRV
jgi:hypothetical protein